MARITFKTQAEERLSELQESWHHVWGLAMGIAVICSLGVLVTMAWMTLRIFAP